MRNLQNKSKTFGKHDFYKDYKNINFNKFQKVKNYIFLFFNIFIFIELPNFYKNYLKITNR